MRGRTFATVALALVAMLFAASCGGSKATSGPVSATERDFNIALGTENVAAGTVTFKIKNAGPSTHEFVVFKTDLAPDKLPIKAGVVNEEGPGVKHIDEVEDIKSGGSGTLTVKLPAGSYVVICNLPGHYLAGMHTGITVSD